MISKNIINSISPLKARKGKGVAGKVGMKATATRAQDRSGFSRSGVVPSGKGYMSNLESLTAGTRLTSSLADSFGVQDTGPTTGKTNFGDTSTFEDIEAGSEFKQDPEKITKKGEKVPYEDYEKACNPARKKYLMEQGGSTWMPNGVFNQAKFDKECAEYEAHTKKEGYKSSGGKTVETETRTDGQKYQQDYNVVDGEKIITKPWYKID